MKKIIQILLVEDDQLDIIDIKRTLDKMNILYNMQIATNGEEAVEKLEEAGNAKPDFILIDINMPKMDGLELLSVIRQRDEWKNIKCFMITTSSATTDKEEATRLGVSGYIIKPFKINNPSSMDSFNLMIDLMNY
ncbi:MAG TPA: response regulator [Sphingobacteriaceae bacterium]